MLTVSHGYTTSLRVQKSSKILAGPHGMPCDYPLVQVSCGLVGMAYNNTRTISHLGRTGPCGPMRCPYEAHRTNRPPGPQGHLYDPNTIVYGACTGPKCRKACMNVVYAQFSGTC